MSMSKGAMNCSFFLIKCSLNVNHILFVDALYDENIVKNIRFLIKMSLKDCEKVKEYKKNSNNNNC